MDAVVWQDAELGELRAMIETMRQQSGVSITLPPAEQGNGSSYLTSLFVTDEI